MRITPKILIITLLADLAALFFCCGGSEIGNPKTTVEGAICDSSGTRIAEVSLFLIDTSITDPQQLVADSCKGTFTGADGSYRFTDVYEGGYNLFGITSAGDRMMLRKIDLTCGDNIVRKDETFTEGIDTIRPPANVIVNVDSCLSRSGNFIYVPGTVIRVTVDSCGEYLVKCPASKIDLLYYRNDSLEILDSNLNLSAGKWFDLTAKSYTIPKPMIISGTVAGSVGRMYLFSADSIDMGSNHPVQYRFDWGDIVSSWYFSPTVGHSWNTIGMYKVSIQARSCRDTLSISKWSDSTEVIIEDSPQ